ncbi:glycosyltransferase [Cognatiluteimonas lumbrici]|uniref:glycosyltransferase n=1 Tax=Cognatiluteimonas lumbrici TaxID=2559601 RepID=UPI0011281639|nr:glycosyltransferase [Luteimonas lumbrici]
MTQATPHGTIPLAILDPALGRSGAHNLGFAELMLAHPPGPLGFWCADALPAAQRERLERGGAHVAPSFAQDFYALYHQSGGVAEHWDWIHALCGDYMRALRQVLERWPGTPVQVLHHTLSWEHATALSLALGLLGAPGQRLRHLALLMYAPGVAPDGQVLDPARRLNFRLAFAALDRIPEVTLHASCSEHAAAYAALLGRSAPLPLHPCFLGDWREPPASGAREPGRVLAYVGEAKQEKGFLELPARLARMAGDDPAAHARFVVHCVEARTDAARAVMDEVRALAAGDPRILVHEGHWSDQRLHEEFSRASLVCLDYDPETYAHKTSGLLWLAAWHRVPVRVPGASWLAREAVRLGLPVLPADAPADPARARTDVKAAGEAYRQAIFQPFDAWLAAQAGEGAEPSPAAPAAAPDPDALDAVHAAIGEETRRPARAVAGRPGAADVVLFWKQNDSTLYGRRNDMVAHYLAGRPDVRRVLVVDAPVSDLRLATLAGGDGVDQSRWIHERTLEKLRGERDHGAILHRVFAYDGNRFGMLAHEEPDAAFIAAYGDWLAGLFEREGIEPARSAFWIYPRDFCMPALLQRFAPDRVVVDMVDDDRAWPGVPDARKERLGRNYAELLQDADLVLANCAPVQAGLQAWREDVRLVPNGVDEAHGRMRPPGRPPEAGAVIGYLGNLEAKIDVPLLDAIATRFPQHRLVLVGSTHANPAVRGLLRHPNVEMPGVVPYDRVGDWLSRFDVAVIPHLDMELTRRMNPLKTHVYLAWGIPVVSTAVANVQDDGELVRMVVSHRAFLHQLGQVLSMERPPAERFRAHVAKNGWRSRLETVVDELRLGELG